MMAAPVSDLPAPDSPTTPSTSPAPSAKEMPSTAVTVPRRAAKAMRRSSTSSRGRRVASVSDTMAAGNGTVDAQARIDGVIKEVDDEIDDDEEEGDQHEIGGHHRDVGKADRLDDEKRHAGPLEDRLGDDCEGDDRAELQSRDGDHRNQRVLERMAEIDGAVGEAASAREFDVVGAQHLQHLRPHQPHDQGQLDEAERDRRHDQRPQPVDGEEGGGPPAERHRRAAPERRQPAEDDGKDEDEQDTGEECRQRDADERDGQEDLRQKGMAMKAGIDAERHAEQQGDEGGNEAQFQRRRQTLDDNLGHRPRILIRQAEIAMYGAPDEARKLHDERIVETERLTELVAVLLRRVLPDHVVDRVADEIEQREGNERDRQHNDDRLQQTANDEGDHGW